MASKKMLMGTAKWLTIIGALNWGFATFNFNLVTWLANTIKFPVVATIIYALVGLSGLYLLIKEFD